EHLREEREHSVRLVWRRLEAIAQPIHVTSIHVGDLPRPKSGAKEVIDEPCVLFHASGLLPCLGMLLEIPVAQLGDGGGAAGGSALPRGVATLRDLRQDLECLAPSLVCRENTV